jgi:glycerate kinase
VTIIGLEQAIEVGDLFIVGEGALDDRTWRISSLKPIIGENKAEITAVVWSADILNRDGLVIS